MYPCHVANVTSYGMKKDGLKKKLSKESNSKTEKGRAIFFEGDRLSKSHTHCYKVSSRYSIWLPSYGMHIDNVEKTNQREVTQKLRMREQSFLYATHCLDLIHIAIKFHQNIPYGYLVMASIRIVRKKKINQ